MILNNFVKVMKKISFALMLILLAAGCAESAKDTIDDWEAEVITAYIKVNYPDSANSIMRDALLDGGYILCGTRREASEGDPKFNDFVMYDVTGRLLDGSIFKTTQRSSAEMLMYPTSSFYSTHFVPVYDSMESASMPAGVADMLKLMKTGDSVTLLLPSGRAYGSVGYTGYMSVAAGTPVIFDIALRRVIRDPRQAERDSLLAFVRRHNAINPASEFVRICDTAGCPEDIYIRYIDTTSITDTTPLPAADTTIYLKYAGSYLDGVWFDTNIDSIARKWLQSAYKLKTAYTTTYSHTLGSGASIPAFDAALGRLNRGSKVEIVFASKWGYGSGVVSSTSSSAMWDYVIPPYTPLRFWIYREK